MDQPRSLKGQISRPSQLLVVRVFGNTWASGVVFGPGDVFGPIRCSLIAQQLEQTCTYNVAFGSQITLTAGPGSFFVSFSGWGGACRGVGACTFTMDGPKSVSAEFFRGAVSFRVSGGGTGSGTVTSSPSGISCSMSAGQASGTCVTEFLPGGWLTLTAVPALGSVFTGWVGGMCDQRTSATCSGTVENGRAFTTATFGVAPP